jgi:deoxyribose-phosphate aldolase
MPAFTPIQPTDLEFDHGFFDSAAFAAETLKSWQPLASIIDHTLMEPEATRTQVEQLCHEAAKFHFACAVVNPIWVATAVKMLARTGVPVGAAIGFPFGATLVSTLRHEAATLTRLGARELDIVLPVGVLKSGDYSAVHRTIHAVATVAHHRGALLKVILETALLTMEEKLRASEIAIQAGADFIKSSTGFSTGGATVADVALMRGVAGARCGVKASGGIRTLAEVKAMLEAGANRIGSSASVAIVSELGAE